MRKLVLVLFMLLLFYGCVEERQISISGYEQVESISGTDITGDEINDYLLYSYGEKRIDDKAGISMKKTVSAYPISISVKMINYSTINSFDLQYIKGKISEFKQLKNAGENTCLAKLNIDRDQCNDEDACLMQCTSTTCENVEVYGKETFAYELYQFNYNARELDQLITEVEAVNSVLTQREKDALAEKLVNMMGLSAKISSNLLFRHDAYGICNAPQYDGGLLADALSRVGSADIDMGSYGYKAVIFIDGRSDDEFIELYISDTPPLSLAVDQFSLDILENGKLQEKEPLTVGWDAVPTDTARKIIYYDFVSSTEPTEEVLSKWKFAKIKERNLKGLTYINDVYDHPVGAFVFGVSGFVFESSSVLGYYAAVGAAISLWVVVLFLILLALETLYFVLRAVMDRKNISNSLLDAFGAPMADWKAYTLVGIVLIASSVMLNLFYTSPVESSEGFVIEELVSILASDFSGAGCVVLFVIGAYTLFLVLEDWLKGLMLGRDYYELKGATKEENLQELAKLRESWQALRMRVEDLSKTGMVVTEEYAIIVSVPIERLEQMIASEKQGMARQLIRFNQERLESLDKRLDEKVNVMNQKWPEWRGELGKALTSSDHVPLNTLLFIPIQWREWAVEKYISENRTKGYVLEGDVIVRREVKVDELLSKRLKDLVNKEIAKDVVLLSQDAEVYNSFKKSKTVADVLFLKLRSYIVALSKKMGAKEIRRFVISGDKTAAVYVNYNKYHAFIVAEKANIKNVVEEWAAIVERLS